MSIELNKIYNENCLNTTARMPDNYLDCCITSPPYYGLRDYGTGKWVGGDENCDHIVSDRDVDKKNKNSGNKGGVRPGCDAFYCKICGAKRIDKQIGLEDTPEEYVAKITEVFSEIKRVLKPEGTLWLNIGDSYWGGKGRSRHGDKEFQQRRYKNKSLNNSESHIGGRNKTRPTDRTHSIIKPKDLIGIPWMVAFALRADGWYLRQDIIWNKPNPMPESVKDRCTKSHEYIFLLTKSKKYFYDAEAIKVPLKNSSIIRLNQNIEGQKGSDRVPGKTNGPMKTVGSLLSGLANKRSVWHVNTQPYKEAHFAVFPEMLIVDCIKAGCPKNGITYDPFMGAGTTAKMAHILGRSWIGSELNKDYVDIANKRLQPYIDQKRLF